MIKTPEVLNNLRDVDIPSPTDNYVLTYDAATGLWGAEAISVTSMDAENVEIEEIGEATYDDIQDWINNTQSAGYIEGGIMSDAGAGKINTTALRGFIKTTDSEIGITKSFNLAAQTNLDILTTGKINYVYVKFTAPSTIEILATVTRSDIELNRQFTLGRVYRDGTTLHIMQSGVQLANFMRKEHERLYEVRYVERASGLIVTDDEDRTFDLSAGVFYAGRNKVEIESALDTSTDYFTYWSWINNAWAKTAHDQTQISNRQYNDVSGVGALANLTSNRYGVHWVFLDLDGHLQVLYGQGDYKLTQAQDAALPSNIPDFLQHYCLLVARIIKKEQIDKFTEIAAAYQVFFPTTLITDHGELGGLDDDDHSQYHTDGRGDIRYLYKENEAVFTPDGDYEPATKKYVDDNAGVTDHGVLTGLGDDDHTIYALVDASRAFTGEVEFSNERTNITGVDLDSAHWFRVGGSDEADIMFGLHDEHDSTIRAVGFRARPATAGATKKELELVVTAQYWKNAQTNEKYFDITHLIHSIDDDLAKVQFQWNAVVKLILYENAILELQGNLDANTHNIVNVVDPVDDQDAATKKYIVDNYTKDHGSMDGLDGDDHSQYYMVAGRTADELVLAKQDSNLEGGQMVFKPADNDKVPHDIWMDRYDGDIRFFRNDSDASVTVITTNQYGAGGSVTFEADDLAWKETKCHICGEEFQIGDKICMVIHSILVRPQDRHPMAVPICKKCFKEG